MPGCVQRRVFLSGLALMLSACTSTASRELVVSIQNYDARSQEAIAAVDAIERKAVEQPIVPPAESEREFVAGVLASGMALDGSKIDAQGNPIDPEILVQGLIHPTDTTISRSRARGEPIPALEEMRCAHEAFTRAFDRVESAGFLAKRPVAEQAPAILDQLIAQQLLLAKIVALPNKPGFNAYKTDLVAQMEAVRRSQDPPAVKSEQLLRLHGRWLLLEAEERALNEAAVEQLVKAAATGLSLREQLTDYGKWSITDLTDSARELSGFISLVSGKDLGELDQRVDSLTRTILADQDLNSASRQVLAAIDVPTLGPAAGSSMPTTSGRNASAVEVSTMPCLAALNSRGITSPVPDQESGNGGQ